MELLRRFYRDAICAGYTRTQGASRGHYLHSHRDTPRIWKSFKPHSSTLPLRIHSLAYLLTITNNSLLHDKQVRSSCESTGILKCPLGTKIWSTGYKLNDPSLLRRKKIGHNVRRGL